MRHNTKYLTKQIVKEVLGFDFFTEIKSFGNLLTLSRQESMSINIFNCYKEECCLTEELIYFLQRFFVSDILNKDQIISNKIVSLKVSDLFDIKVGIYFLFQGDEIVYVGQSNSIIYRLCSHIKEEQKKFDGFSFQETELKNLNFYEAIYINLLNPIYNTGFLLKHINFCSNKLYVLNSSKNNSIIQNLRDKSIVFKYKQRTPRKLTDLMLKVQSI